MFWLDRLNSGLNRLQIGAGRVEFLHWWHEDELVDNWPHRHTYFEACLVGRHGTGKFIDPSGDHELVPGTLFIARPGVVHQIVNTTDPLMELYWVAFGCSQESNQVRSDGDRAIRAFLESDICVAPDQLALLSLWEALRANSALPWRVGSDEQVSSIARAIVLGIAQALSSNVGVEIVEDPTRAGRLAASQAVRYIEDNLNRQLSLEEIAAHINVSTRQLTRLFSAFTGTSPAQYVRITRLDRASALLSRSELPIKEISHQIGFSDVQYFTRCFTAHFGVSPGAYRNGARCGQIIQRPGMLL